MTFRYILHNTPALILTTTGTDVFEATIGSLVYSPSTVIDDMVEAAWERFGQRPIGDYDYEHWLTTFADAVKFNFRWYSKALPIILGTEYINAYDSYSSMNETENVIVDGEGSNANTRRDTGTVANTGTVGVSGTFTNTNSGTVVQAQETMPDTTGASNYLAGRVTTTDTTALANSHADTTTNNLTQTNNLTVTDSATSTNDTETDRTHTITNNGRNRPMITLTIEMVKQLEELNDLYLSRLDKYFMNRW